MTEPIPCTECTHIIPGNYHCCIACASQKDSRIAELTKENKELTRINLGLNSINKDLLKANSELCQPEMDLK